ncbi:IclR family transcriptional regulator [Haloglomus litoreum]|uniref:IclR family transcriptional regulator n=1 Tax=Haloglomus litoreum TaxID=3034026 RepID=UPI0023E77847|nr:IclR family transcriptional regulator [Haloglomus sp. DT116]
MSSGNEGRKPVQTTKTTFEIIEAIRTSGGARVTELATELDVAKSTIHRHVTTLHDLGYLVKDGDTHEVGLRFLSLGEYARTRDPAYTKLQPKVATLAEQTGESVQFLVPEHGRAVYVHRAEGDNAVNTPNSRIGERIPLHSTAAGKSILACYPPETVEEILETVGLDPVTDNTITDPEAFRNDLDTIRERGYSVNEEENVEGVYAVGVPIKRTDGRPIGALSISGPAHRLQNEASERELSTRLLETANELELNIAYS